MNEATLDFSLGIYGSDGFGKAGQAIHGKDQHVVYAPVFELIEHAEPVLGGFALAKPDAQALLAPLQVDADHQVGGHILDPTVRTELEEQRVHEHNGVNRLQRPVLPFLGLVDDGVGNPADRFRRNVVVVDFLDVVLDIAGTHPLGIHGKDELLEAADILLAFLDDGRVELGFPVPRNIDDDGTDLRGQLFLAVAVTAIAGIALRGLVAIIAEEAGHLGSHGRLDHVLDHRTENGIEVVQAGDLSLEHLPGQFVTVDQHGNLLGLLPLSGGLHSFRYRPLRYALVYLFFPPITLLMTACNSAMLTGFEM